MRHALLLLLLVSALIVPAVAHADSPSHLVQPGETLYSIARAYGISPQALAAANDISLQSWVYVGQYLSIPNGSEQYSSNSPAPVSVAQASPGGIYLVRAGDTLSSLSRKFGVSVDTIANANDIPPNGFLYTGTQLRIPGIGQQVTAAPSNSVESKPVAPSNNAPAKPAVPANNAAQSNSDATNADAAKNTTYLVKAGDTLYAIAIRNNVTMAALRVKNNLPTPFVYTGQSLIIPNAVTASNQAPSPQPKAQPAAPASNSVSAGLFVELKDVPAYVQKQTLTCEESAAAMATRGALTEAQIVAAMPRSENPFEGIRGTTNYDLIGGLTHYGTYAQGLQKGLAKLGHQSTAYYGQSYADFKATIIGHLKEGRPVLWWTTWRESYQRPQQVQLSSGEKISLTPYEHTVLIVAATEDGITYNDPYDGTVRFTSWANHQRTSGYFNNMALVVY